MLPEIGASELLVIAVVALIVVGPKDLPMLLRKLGQFMAKVRGMASEFRASFDEMARQSELDELRKEVDAMRKGQLTDIALQASADASQVVGDIRDGLAIDTAYPYTPQAYEPPPEPAAKPARKPRAKPAATPVAKAPATKATAKATAKPAAAKAKARST